MASSSKTTFVDANDLLARRAAQKRGLISFAGGLPDPALFPKRQLSQAFLSAVGADAVTALQYGWPEGSRELREQIASELAARGASVEAERIIITSGAQQAIQIATTLAGPRPRIAVEPETYPGALEIFRSARAKLVGMAEAAQLYYVMPSVSNPRGQRLSDEERLALFERARHNQGYIVEDDAYAGTRFSTGVDSPLLATHPDRVFHVGTYSKTLCPGLRIGWLVAPKRLAKRALGQKQASDLQANGLSQALLVQYLQSGHFAGLQRRARAHYRRKLRRLLAAVQRHLPQLRYTAPIGGFSLWLDCEQHLSDTRLLEAAIARGVSFDLGHRFRAAPAKTLAIRLCFSAVADADIEPGVARIAQAFAKAFSRRHSG
jgi:2-aminoadipate transaminase